MKQPNTNPNPNQNAKTAPKEAAPAGEKLQKALASLGLGSRRQLEEVIRAGRVMVNGQVAHIGARVQAGDDITLDGRKVRYAPLEAKVRRVIAYYKPEGEICAATDPEGRTTVFERLPRLSHDRWIMVGRLDLNSTGLLLFTNDGELANRLMHPSHEVVREYAVRVLGEVTDDMVKNLTRGVELEDGMAKFDNFKAGGGTGANKWYHVTLHEGKNREVRRLFESQGLTVSRLLRTRYGSINIPKGLKTGRWRELDNKEIDSLLSLVGIHVRPKRHAFGMRKKEARPQSKEEARRAHKKEHRRVDRVQRKRSARKTTAHKGLADKTNK